MIVLVVRTDQPEAYVALFDDVKKLKEKTWLAHRELSDTILAAIDEVTEGKVNEIQGLVVYKGPGSFTGLRIGLSVVNSLAYSLGVPVVAENDDDWIEKGLSRLKDGDNDKIAAAEYGGEANITKPRK